MPQLCTVTGPLIGPDGTVFANQRARFELVDGIVGVPDGTIIPEVVEITTDEDGDFSVDLWTGNYKLRVIGARQIHSIDCPVPDAASAFLKDLVSAGSVPQVSAWLVEARLLDKVVPIVLLTESRALLPTDAGKSLRVDSEDDVVITVPTGATVFPGESDDSAVIEFWRLGAGGVTIAAASGVTLICSHSGRSLLQGGSASIRKHTDTKWLLAGEMI